MTVVVTSGSLGVSKLAVCAIPFVIAPTGTMANNGAITLGTALPATYASCYLNLPANAIQAGSSAGWYFCQMSSTTAGTVFNNTYSSGTPSIPSSPTAFVSTGPGAYTGVTTAQTGPQITIPAGSMGQNGVLRATHFWSTPNNANNKTLNLTVGGTSFYSAVVTTFANNAIQTDIFNRGSQAIQISPAQGSAGVAQGAGALTFSAVNFANAQTAAFIGTLAVATDFLVLESFLLEMLPG